MNKILVDTSVIIDFLRRKDKKSTLFWKEFYNLDNIPVVTLTVVVELWAGQSVDKVKVRREMELLIEDFEIVHYTIDIAKLAGEILRMYGVNIGFQDAVIAASAIYYELPLFTLNTKHFEIIPQLALYTPVNP